MTSTKKRLLALLALITLPAATISGVSHAGHSADPGAHPLPVINLEQDSKAMVVKLNMTGPGTATMVDADVVFGRARGRSGEPPLLDVQVFDDKNGLAQRFNAWDPRWVEVEGATPGEMSMRVVSSAIGDFVFPFESDLKTLTVSNTYEDQSVGSYDLREAIREFCEAHPNDVDCRTDLSISKSDSADPAVAGTDLTYTMTVTNQGPNPAHSARVVDTLPAGLTFVSGSPGCTDASGVVTCQLGAIPSGESRTVTITARIDPALVYNAGGPVTIQNTAATENPAGNDPDPTDNTNSESTLVVAEADVKINEVSAAAPIEVLIGEPATATIGVTVQNDGPSSPINTVLTGSATSDSGLTVTPTSTSADVEALAIGSPRTVDQPFALTCSTPGVKNVELAYELALANSEDTDPDLTNNTGTVSFRVDCAVPVAINIRPRGFPNSINLNTDATLAVLTTEAGEYGLPLSFDARTIEIETVRFGLKSNLFNLADPDGGSEIHGRNHLERSYELDEQTRDADVDGVMHFKPPESKLTLDSTTACVKGKFTSGADRYTFLGCDSIRVTN